MQETTEFEFELSETIAYSRPGEKVESYCPACKAFVVMAAPHVAAILTHATEREIYRLVETGQVHFTESDRVLICLKSLSELNRGNSGRVEEKQ